MNDELFAVIMAGGKGTRLTSITKDIIPKPMVQIGGKPVLQWQIEQLREQSIKDIVIVVGYLGEKIIEYFGHGENFDVNISYLVEYTPMGTGGMLSSIPHLGDNFILIFGDILFNIDVKKMLTFHKEKQALCTLFVHPNNHPYDSNIVILDDDNKVTNILGKEGTHKYWYPNCTSAGIYIFKTEICQRFSFDILDLEQDIIKPLIKEEIVYGYNSSEYVKDMGIATRLQEAEKDIENNLPEKRSLKHKQKAIFLDRDGTINEEVGLIHSTTQLKLIPHAAGAIRKINDSDYLAIIITNQPVVAKGMCTLADLRLIHYKLETLLGEEGAFLNAIYYCPHHPEKGFPEENPLYKVKCDCRKPKTGLFTRAAEDFNIDLTQSWMIGDRETDVQAGQNAGTNTILLKEDLDLYDAINLILGD